MSAAIFLVSIKGTVSAMMCHGGSEEHDHSQKKQQDRGGKDKKTSGIKESFYDTVYLCPMHPEVKEEKPGKCPDCGMKLEKKQVLTAYVCPEPPCEYRKARLGKCPEHKKELIKAELNTHCPKCGGQINAEDLKLEPEKTKRP